VTGLLFGMALAIVVLVVLLTLTGARCAALMDYEAEDQDIAHAKCIAHIADVTSKRVVALAFRDAAARWDRVETQTDLTMLRKQFKYDSGPSIPAMWLNQQADLLDPEVES
jgi:hypothetical protein